MTSVMLSTRRLSPGDSFVRNVEVAGQLRIDGHEPVFAAHLHAMPGIEQQRDLCLRDLAQEIADQAFHAAAVEIGAFQHLEAKLAQGHRHRARIPGQRLLHSPGPTRVPDLTSIS